MKNIGTISSEWLHKAGIETIDELREIGFIPVYCLIKNLESSVSLNLLWALEGALHNKDFREITLERKNELKCALKNFQDMNPL